MDHITELKECMGPIANFESWGSPNVTASNKEGKHNSN
jgi:hypothetical protein